MHSTMKIDRAIEARRQNMILKDAYFVILHDSKWIKKNQLRNISI